MVDQLRMLQAAVEQVGQGVLLAGADGTVWAANAAARRLLGNPPAHLADLLGSDEAGTAV